MLNERVSAARQVRAAFLEAERLQDDAAIGAAQFLVTALQQRRQANLPVTIGTDALERVAQAAQFAVKARNELMLAHPELRAAASDIGVSRMLVDDGTCPGWTAEQVDLKVVA